MKKRKPQPDAFAAALAMLGGVVPAPCQACMGRRWILGRYGKARCHGCRGEGVR